MKLERLAGFNHLYRVDKVDEDLQRLFDKDKSCREKYDCWLHSKLLFLDMVPINVLLLQQPKCFEKLHGVQDDLYVIRYISGAANTRMIFVINKLDEDAYVLLHAFNEKRDSDYARGIKLALQRSAEVKAMTEEMNNGNE